MKRREYCYILPPERYELPGCDCGTEIPAQWSEFSGMLWCPVCQKDFKPSHDGLFGGPIPAGAAKALGVVFDRIHIATGRREIFDIESGTYLGVVK